MSGDLSEEGEFDRIVQALRLGMEQRQTVAPEPALEPPPDPIPDRNRTFSASEERSVAEAYPTHTRQEPEPTPISAPEKPLVPDQKSRRVSVVTIVSLALAVVGALAAVIVVPEVREWLRLDKPLEPRKTSAPISTPQEITTSIGMEFVRIPAGEFQMGSNEGLDDERPVHRVRISEPFYMGKYEVTQAQWEAVMRTNPSYKGNPNRPVETVSWEDVQEFIKRLNRQEGWEVCRLPTEAQWEYAARAGTTPERYENDLDAIAWFGENSGWKTHDVGQKQPNAWGLYDMLGNVWEWVQDWYAADYYRHSPTVDPQGPDAGALRVVRGGGWIVGAQGVRAAVRLAFVPGNRLVFLGFRCSSSGPSK